MDYANSSFRLRNGRVALRAKLSNGVVVGANLFLNQAVVRRVARCRKRLAQRLQPLFGRDHIGVRIRVDGLRRGKGSFGLGNLLAAPARLLAFGEQLPIQAFEGENLRAVGAGIYHRPAAHRQRSTIAALEVGDLRFDLLELALEVPRLILQETDAWRCLSFDRIAVRPEDARA